MRTLLFAAATLAGALALHAQQAPLEQVVRTAAEKSSLALPGHAPFHLRASIADEKDDDPQWTASVEEWWASPTEYQRVLHSTRFIQALVVQGDKVEEVDAGRVFPELLRNLESELTVVVPRYDQLAALHQTVDVPDGAPGQIVARWDIIGTDGTVTKAIKASVAISRQTGLFIYGGDIDWDVALHDFADFHGLQIARKLTAQAGRGPTLTARITLLEDLDPADRHFFQVERPTLPEQRLRVMVVPELEMRKLLITSPKPQWPTATKPGAIVMRIVVDRTGQVRSVDDFYSDDPAAEPAAEAAVLQWRFKPYLDHGAPVQVISTVTLSLE